MTNEERSPTVPADKTDFAFGNPATPIIGTRSFASPACAGFAFVVGNLPPSGADALRASPLINYRSRGRIHLAIQLITDQARCFRDGSVLYRVRTVQNAKRAILSPSLPH